VSWLGVLFGGLGCGFLVLFLGVSVLIVCILIVARLMFGLFFLKLG